MNSILLATLVLFAISSFYFGRSKIKKVALVRSIEPKALPKFYGYYQALWCSIPAFLIISFWTFFEPIILKNLIESRIQSMSLNELSKDELNLIYSQIVSFSQGTFTGQISNGIKSGVETYQSLLSVSQGAKIVLFFCAIIIASLFSFILEPCLEARDLPIDNPSIKQRIERAKEACKIVLQICRELLMLGKVSAN